jgi:hypothetical protein
LQEVFVDQGLDNFFHKERGAFSFRQHLLLERDEIAISTEQAGKELFCFRCSQWGQLHVGIIRLLSPRVVVFWSIVHEEQDIGSVELITKSV